MNAAVAGGGVLGRGEVLGWWRAGAGSPACMRWGRGRAAAARGGRRGERARSHRIVAMNAPTYSESASGRVLARRCRTGSWARKVELAVVSSPGIDV